MQNAPQVPVPESTLHQVLEGAVGAAGMALAFFTPFLRASRDHWGLSAELADRPLPGDVAAGAAAYSWTHGLQMDAPASVVWPWVVQVGQDRAGFYSYQFLENLMGCGIHNATAIQPEWQSVAVGDALKLHPTMPPLTVIEVKPGHHFVALARMNPKTGFLDADAANNVTVSWLFLVEPVDALRCRFISRFRLGVPGAGGAAFAPWMVEPVGFVMDRRMLLGVRERVGVDAVSPSLAAVGPLDLQNRTCLVTGATRGIGRATAEWLARAGAEVGLLCRDAAAAQQVAAELARIPGTKPAFVIPMDLSSMSSVVRGARAVLDRCPRVDVLIHNAGEYRTERALTQDGFERMLAVGYLGPWLLTQLLRPRLLKSAPCRVVVTAGAYHRKGHLDLQDMQWAEHPWNAMDANNRIQLARASFALELSRQLEGTGVTVNAVHPGAVRTQAQDALTGWQRAFMDTLGRFVFVDPREGALPNLRLAGETALSGVTGEYFSGVERAQASEDARNPEQARALWDWTRGALARWLPDAAAPATAPQATP